MRRGDHNRVGKLECFLMADIYHFWGSDLTASPSGDLLLVEPLAANDPASFNGNDEGTQRIYRRLMTGYAQPGHLSGEDIFAPGYGGGVPMSIGSVMNPAAIRGITKAQMFQEAAVAKSPAPTVVLTPVLPGTALVDIKYVNAQTGQPISLSFDTSS